MNAKKLLSFVLVFALSIIFAGCSKPQPVITPDRDSVLSPPSLGGSVGDAIKVDGPLGIKPQYFVGDGHWIYYRNSLDNGLLYRMGYNGDNNFPLIKEPIRKIALLGDYLFFTQWTSETKEELFKINKQNSQIINLSDDFISEFIVTNDRIYYQNRSDDLKIYSVTLEGESRTKITDAGVRCINSVGDYLFYINNDDNGIYRVKNDGTDNRALITDTNSPSTNNLIVDNDYIYYGIIDYEESTLYKASIDGKPLAKTAYRGHDIISISGTEILYTNDFLYSNNLMRMSIDGSNTMTLSMDVESDQATRIDDYIYYFTTTFDVGMYKKNTISQIETTLIKDEYPSIVKIIDGWIYHSNNRGFYRTNLDTGTSILLDHNNIQDSNRVFYMFIEGDWVYYTGFFEDGHRLFRSKLDGTLIAQDLARLGHSFSLYEDFIYYSDTDYNIYKVALDGSFSEKLVENKGYILTTKDGWVYCRSISINNQYTYRISLKDKSIEKIGDFWPSRIEFQGDWLYFQKDFTTDNSIYRFNTITSKLEQLPVSTEFRTSNDFIIHGNWIFFIDDGNLKRSNLDGSNKMIVSDVNYFESIHGIRGDYIFHSLRADGGGPFSWGQIVYRTTLDGKETGIFRVGILDGILLSDDHVIYSDATKNYSLIRVKTDGSDRKVLK